MAPQELESANSMNMSSPLSYPDKFHIAVKFVQEPPPEAKTLSQETRLLLYALHQQAMVGPCKEPKPWGWNAVENAKWTSWNKLGNLSAIEAMRLYVRTLEEDQADWCQLLPNEALTQQSGGSDAGAAANGAVGAATPNVWNMEANGEWVAPFIHGSKYPTPRYEHGAAVVDHRMFVIGGNCSGKRLSDVWMLNMETMAWSIAMSGPAPGRPSALPTSQPQGDGPPALPPAQPVAGSAVVSKAHLVLVLGGHTKEKDPQLDLAVCSLDTSTMMWAVQECAGAAPQTRGNHTATLLGNRVVVFGGEDPLRRPLNDVHVLDLDTMAWTAPKTSGTAPAARSAHAATAYRDRYVVVFGGGSVAHCFNDLHVLDTHTWEWSRPEVTGSVPCARAGHAAALLDDAWYILGGGNNSSGCPSMYRLDLAPLGKAAVSWAQVANVPPKSAAASEGQSMVAVPSAGALVAFGGYNGTYWNVVQVFKPAPASAAPPDNPEANGILDGEAEPPVTSSDAAARPSAAAAPSSRAAAADPVIALQSQLEAARAEGVHAVREAAAVKEAAAAEVAGYRQQLAAAEAEKEAALKAAADLKAKLKSEQQKVVKLEVQVAEARQQLERVKELETELGKYKKMAEEAQQKAPGGIWGYITG